MSVRKFRTSAADAQQPLAAWLAMRLAEPIAAAHARVAAGAVYVDGKRERDPGRLLAAAQTITVQPGAAAAPSAPWRVVLESADVLVVDKPAGLATQATREAGGALDEQVALAYPGATLAHRIDRDTSGLVLFARTDAGRARLAQLLASRALVREYLAIVRGVPPAATFVLDAPLGPDPRDHLRQAARAPQGKPARTDVTVVRTDANLALLRCRLDTGRTHQIRVHLADAGLPILGDPLYAPPEVQRLAPRLALHAARLAWPPAHDVSAPLPDELARLLPGA